MTVYRDDLGEQASVSDLEALSGKRRGAKLDAIRDACRSYLAGPLYDALAHHVQVATAGQGAVSIDPDDATGQTLLIAYPSVRVEAGSYVRPVVRIESGAKSALDTNRPVTIHPFIADDAVGIDLAVPGVTTIEPSRTFWDKVVILNGLRRWYERRGMLRQEGQRISRHYYDLHCMMHHAMGAPTMADRAMGADCVRHARMFFDRPDYDLASASPGTFALAPLPEMADALASDYEAMAGMIFGAPPSFEDVLDSIRALEAKLSGPTTART